MDKDRSVVICFIQLIYTNALKWFDIYEVWLLDNGPVSQRRMDHLSLKLNVLFFIILVIRVILLRPDQLKSFLFQKSSLELVQETQGLFTEGKGYHVRE